jgi:chromate transporter
MSVTGIDHAGIAYIRSRVDTNRSRRHLADSHDIRKLPSFLIILGIALFFQQFRDNETVQRIFKGIRPAVVALIAAPTFKMGKSAKIGMTNVWIPVVSALLIWLLGVSPIYIIIMAGLGGYLYGRYIKPSESK